jgi:hypothetical protein
MMQLAWFCDNVQFELRGYENIARCYFYMQNVQKAGFYIDRFMRGKLENPRSNQRQVSTEFLAAQVRDRKSEASKSEIAGYRVIYTKESKFVD